MTEEPVQLAHRRVAQCLEGRRFFRLRRVGNRRCCNDRDPASTGDRAGYYTIKGIDSVADCFTVANQKARYLVRKLNRMAKGKPAMEPFEFKNQGALAYLGAK